MPSLSRCRRLFLGLPLLVAGCGQVPSLEEAKQSVTQAVQSAPTIIDNGKFELTAGTAISTSGCYVRTAAFSAGRPAIVQFTSYKEPKSEGFPSIFVRAELPSGTAALAAGQVLQAQVYLQEKADGPVLHVPVAQVVEINVTKVEGTTIDATISRGGLVNSETGANVGISGTIHAVAP